MAEQQINVGLGIDVGQFTKGLANAATELGSFVKKSTSELDILSRQYNTAVRDAAKLAKVQGTTSEAYLEAAKSAQLLYEKMNAINGVSVVTEPLQQAQQATKQMANGFNGLSFSVAQLTREMPAFTYSMQTGFMALSNNIPMLFDQIKLLRIENEKLAASGQPTASVFKSLAGAIFSWQTGLSVGITLLTVFGARMFGAGESTKGATKALEDQTKALKDYTSALNDYILTDKQKDINAENKKYQELKAAAEKALQDNQNILDLRQGQNKKYSFEELMQAVNLKKNLEQIEDQHQQNLQKIQDKYKPKDKKSGAPEMPVASGNGSYLEEIDAITPKIGLLTDKVLEFKNISTDAFVGVQGELNTTGVFFDALGEKVGGWAELIASAAGDLAYSLGESLVGATNFGDDVMSIIGGIAGQLGTALISIGAALMSNPLTFSMGIATAASGAALKVISGVLGGLGAKNGNTTTGSQGSYNQANYSGSFTPSYVNNAFYMDGVVRGNNIVIALNNQQRQNKRIR